MRPPRRILRRSVVTAVLLAGLFAAALISPGYVHIHSGGDVPHEHGRALGQASSGHVHSHGHSHSHRHGHSHHHHHDHGHSHDEDDSERVAVRAPSAPHMHFTLLGWEFTITLPGGNQPREVNRSALPVAVAWKLCMESPLAGEFVPAPLDSTIPTWTVSDAESGSESFSFGTPAPLVRKVRWNQAEDAGVAHTEREAALPTRSDPPPVPPPRG